MRNPSKTRGGTPEGFSAPFYYPLNYLWVTVGLVLAADGLIDVALWRFSTGMSLHGMLLMNTVFLFYGILPACVHLHV